MLERPRPLILVWAGVCAALFAVLAFLVHLHRAPLSGLDDFGRTAESWARQSHAFVNVLRGIEAAFAGLGMAILTLLVAVPLWFRNHRRAAVYTVLVMATTSVLYHVLKGLYGRSRPVWQDPIGLLTSRSFPSGH